MSHRGRLLYRGSKGKTPYEIKQLKNGMFMSGGAVAWTEASMEDLDPEFDKVINDNFNKLTMEGIYDDYQI